MFTKTSEPRRGIDGTTVLFRAEKVHGFDREFEEGQGEDLSLSGMFVATRRPASAGTCVRLRIYIPHDLPGETPVTARAIVRWQGQLKGGVRGMGIQFLDFKDIGELRLTIWLDTIAAAQSEAARAAAPSRPAARLA